MSNLTVTLEQARRLKELWRNKPCAFWTRDLWPWWWPRYICRPVMSYTDEPTFYAPTAQELLDVLPVMITIDKKSWRKKIRTRWCCYVPRKYNWPALESPMVWFCEKETLTEALGQLTIRCVENWYLSFEKNND